MAKKRKPNDARRAAKKSAKADKRKKTLAHRKAEAARGEAGPAPWNPRRHGVEGLASRLGCSLEEATGHAEELLASGRREDVRVCWLPSRFRGEGAAAAVEELARVGVATDEASFHSLAEQHQSWHRLAELAWHPLLAPRADVHVRDLCRAAARHLWEEWAPEVVADEGMFAQLLEALRRSEGNDPVGALMELGETWLSVPPGEAAVRLRRSGDAELFAMILSGAAEAIYRYPDLDRALLTTLRDAAAELAGVEGLAPDQAEALRLSLLHLDWGLLGADAWIDRLIAEASVRGTPALTDLAERTWSNDWATPAQLARITEAVEAALDAAEAADPRGRDVVELDYQLMMLAPLGAEDEDDDELGDDEGLEEGEKAP